MGNGGFLHSESQKKKKKERKKTSLCDEWEGQNVDLLSHIRRQEVDPQGEKLFLHELFLFL